jgi:hypothetical protein
MSAAKIPAIRDRMRAQEILTLELAGPVEPSTSSAESHRRSRPTSEVLRRTGDVARRVMRTWSADIVAG